MMESFFLGLIQGLTEFLPVSSSGHLFLLAQFFKTPTETFILVLTVHGATLLSILTVFAKDLKPLLKNKSLLLQTAVALIPLFFTGLFLKPLVVKSFQGNVVSLGFLITGFLLLSLFFKTPTNKPLTFKRAFLIGAIQAICVLPGFSRSGLTIWAGILLGLSPARAAFFSFLIAIPAIAGSLFYELATQGLKTPIMTAEGGMALSGGLVLAFVTAYISGTLSLKVLLKLLHQKKLYLFSLYLIPLGVFSLIFFNSWNI